MTLFSARRAMFACVVSVAAVAALMAPGMASATTKPTPKRLAQCAGTSITMNGSTFQNVAEEQWETGSTNPLSFNLAPSTDKLACQGTEIKNTKGETTKTTGKPEVHYEQTQATKGSGACMHAFGANNENKPAETNIFTICGTDEAPNPTQKKEIEKNREGTPTGESLETIPVTQGSEAIIIHLPAGCKAKSEVEVKGKKYLLGRLVLDQKSIVEVYEGGIENWGQLIKSVTAGKDQLEGCTEGVATAEGKRIRPVVREDSSGTTHIFKAFLQQVNSTHKVLMETFPEEVGSKKTGCGGKLSEEEKYWSEVAEGCENQRWPKKAEVLRPSESGNPGVLDEVAATPSSLAYADDAAAREYEFFSKKDYERVDPLVAGTEKTLKGSGGENKKGTATKVGEQNNMFWAEVNNQSDPTNPDAEFTDPTSTGDVEKLGESNCKNTHYIEGAGNEFPPESTLDSWSEAKAALKEEHYSICGLTYILSFKQYEPYLEKLGIKEAEGLPKVTTAENYLLYVVNSGAGGKAVKGHDYEALPSEVIKIAEKGVKEVEW
jgi:ABC-type phosphate transport system substrate-binding protein